MKNVTNLALFLFALSAGAQEDFSKYKSRNRILIFSTTSLQSEVFKEQWQLYKASSKKLDDRNLLMFALSKGRIYDKDLRVVPSYLIAPLRKKYQIPLSYEGFTLIGKDGGVKIQKAYPVEPRFIFEVIDLP